jgi:hypothetical protein
MAILKRHRLAIASDVQPVSPISSAAGATPPTCDRSAGASATIPASTVCSATLRKTVASFLDDAAVSTSQDQ